MKQKFKNKNRSGKLLRKSSAEIMIKAQNKLDVSEFDQIIKDIKVRHHTYGQYSDDEFNQLIDYYTTEKHKAQRKRQNFLSNKNNNKRRKDEQNHSR